MTEPDPALSPKSTASLEAAMEAAGLRPRGWRSIVRAAWVSSMSSGAMARFLGPGACVLPIATAPLDLAAVWMSRSQLVVWGGAIAQLVPPGARPLPAPRQVVALAAILAGYGALASSVVSVASGLSYRQASWWWWVCWIAIYLLNLLPDMVATKAWILRRKPPSLGTLVNDHQLTMLYGVAAYPRGHGSGGELLRRLNKALDASGSSVVLTARAQPIHALARSMAPSRVKSSDLVDYYWTYGYRSVAVARPPAQRPGRGDGQPYAGRRMVRGSPRSPG